MTFYGHHPAVRILNCVGRTRLHVVLCSVAAVWGWSRLLGTEVLAEDYVVVPLTMASIYTWNRLTDVREDAVNDPAGAAHTAAQGALLAAACAVGTTAAVSLSLLRGHHPAVGYLVVVLMLGWLYSSPLRRLGLSRRLKDVFLVKNLTSCVGWSVLAILYPAAHAGVALRPTHAYALGVMFAAVWTVEVIWDIRDHAGDRAAGVSTIPVRCGRACARRCVLLISGAAAALIVTAIVQDVLGTVWLFVLSSPLLSALWVVLPRAVRTTSRVPSHVLVALQMLLLVFLGVLAGILHVA